MAIIFDKNNKTGTPNGKTNKGNRRVIFAVLVVVLLLTMACIGGDIEVNLVPDKTATEEENWRPSIRQQPVSTPEPTYQREESQGSEAVSGNVETNEYSVTAENFDCQCQVDGDVSQALSVKGDQLFLGTGEGEQVYEKIGANTYKRSWMGYYILNVDGIDTKVDEERSDVIILTANGYIMEHYQGSNSSPCCVHTFTKKK